MQEARLKPESFITGQFRHFTFSRVFCSLEGNSKTLITFKTELFVTLINDWKPIAHVTWGFIEDIKIIYKLSSWFSWNYDKLI